MGFIARALAFGLVPALSVVGSWPRAIALGLLASLIGLALQWRLRAWFESAPSFLATLALLVSVPWGPREGVPDWTLPLIVAIASLGFVALSLNQGRGAWRFLGALGLALAPTVFVSLRTTWHDVNAYGILVGLWGAEGILYQAPVLWLGLFGLLKLRHERPALARLCAASVGVGIAGLALTTEEPTTWARAAGWLPFLLPGLAFAFSRLRDFAVRRPERIVGVAAGLMVLWNVLLMEQYRTRLIPSDETVSFSNVTSQSAALLSQSAGTPNAWPANWIFGKRFKAPLSQWDGVAGLRLFKSPGDTTVVIEFGDDRSVFAPDRPLLIEGFGPRRTCGAGWCRDVDGAGRMLLPLQNAGRADFTITLRARGGGALTMSMSRGATSTTGMSNVLSDATLRVPARSLNAGLNVLSLSVEGGGRVTIDRLTLVRDLSSGSAR